MTLSNYSIIFCLSKSKLFLIEPASNTTLTQIYQTTNNTIMPNTGEVQRKGFKHEIFVKKLKDFEQRTTQNAKHCCQNATATTALLKAELMYSRYSPVKDFQALHEERLASSVIVILRICFLLFDVSFVNNFHG